VVEWVYGVACVFVGRGLVKYGVLRRIDVGLGFDEVLSGCVGGKDGAGARRGLEAEKTRRLALD
jgi:hypothetical protein